MHNEVGYQFVGGPLDGEFKCVPDAPKPVQVAFDLDIDPLKFVTLEAVSYWLATYHCFGGAYILVSVFKKR